MSNMPVLYNITKENLIELYINNKQPSREIAKKYGCCHNTILHLLRKFQIPRRKQNNPRIDISGKKFGKWTVIKMSRNNSRYSITRWLCKYECGTEKEVEYRKLINRESNQCMACKGRVIKGVGNKNHKWTGYKNMPGSMFCRVKQCATTRNLECSISIRDMYNLFIKQNGKCALSGLPITFSACLQKGTSTYKEQTASLDRIDSSKGYTIDNIQWVHKMVQKMKMEFSQEEFITMCKRIASNYC